MKYSSIDHQEFKNFYLENTNEYSRPHFSGYYFGCYLNNKIVGVICYSNIDNYYRDELIKIYNENII